VPPLDKSYEAGQSPPPSPHHTHTPFPTCFKVSIVAFTDNTVERGFARDEHVKAQRSTGSVDPMPLLIKQRMPVPRFWPTGAESRHEVECYGADNRGMMSSSAADAGVDLWDL